MLKILFLDDDSRRRAMFLSAIRALAPGAKVTTTENAVETIAALQAGSFDFIFLDHDLDGRVYVSTTEPNTGSEVARAIRDQNLQPASRIIVHSLNESAALSMIETMGRGEYIPFAWEYEFLKPLINGE